MTSVVFVAPYAMESTNRFLAAVAAVPGARVGVVSSDDVARFPEEVRRGIDAHFRIDDCLDAEQLARGVGSIGAHFGQVDVLTAILENLQVPLAAVRERLGIDGMTVDVAENFRDKARMKSVFEANGIPCARSARVESADAARGVVRAWRQPVVVKPLAGMGARNTFRIEHETAMNQWLDVQPPTIDEPVLMEEFLVGREFSFESVLIDGELAWCSIGRYEPTPLTVLENPWIQWTVILPRSIDDDEFQPIRAIGTRAVRSLGMSTGLSHMEWFLRTDGSIAVSEVGARPPGAQISSLMSWAHDADMYAKWATLIVQRRFEPPERKYAVGAAYLRAQGAGTRITRVSGIDRLSQAAHAMVVESRLPTPGSPPAESYEGEGYVIVRHPDTAAVEAAISEIISTLRVESE